MSGIGQTASPSLAAVHKAALAVTDLLQSQYTGVAPRNESLFHRLARRTNDVLRVTGVRLITTGGYERLLALSGSSYGRLSSSGTLDDIAEHHAAYDSLRALLADDGSRGVFDWFIAMRAAYAQVGEAGLALFPPPIPLELYREYLSKLIRHGCSRVYDVGEFQVESQPEAMVDSMVMEQYRLSGVVEPYRGDTVLDIGAFMGETSLWFAREVGPEGRVVAFEPVTSLARRCVENVERNTALAMAEIRVENVAVGAQSGKCTVSGRGDAGDSVTLGSGGLVSMISVDDYVQQTRLGQVDFIKMDIEGMEREALEGANETIRDFRPKLAISCYHKGDDLRVLADMIHAHVPAYKLYLSHKSPTWHETVLFACCDVRQATSND